MEQDRSQEPAVVTFAVEPDAATWDHVAQVALRLRYVRTQLGAASRP